MSLIVPTFTAYSDVPAGHWAAEDINYVTQRGLFNGTSSTTFGPSDKMSRAMLAAVLYRYAGIPPVSGGTPYDDVAAGQWYTGGVVWAYQNEIFSKLTRETRPLRPGENVRRAEFCIMLYNFAKSLNKAEYDETAIARPFYRHGLGTFWRCRGWSFLL